MHAAYKKQVKLRDVAMEKNREAEVQKHVLEERCADIAAKITAGKNEVLSGVKRENMLLARGQADLDHQLEVLNSRSGGIDKAIRAVTDLKYINVSTKQNLLVEKDLLSAEVARQAADMHLCARESAELDLRQETATQKYYSCLEESMLQDVQFKEMQKRLADDKVVLKSKHAAYEAVRAERNISSKRLVESQEEINVMRITYRRTNSLIEHYKEEIAQKDETIVKEHFKHHGLAKEIEVLRNELTKAAKQVLNADLISANQCEELRKLTRVIDEAEAERARQTNELVRVVAEKNLLTAQNVKRSTELSGTYDKIRIQKSELGVRQSQFDVVVRQERRLQAELRQAVLKNNAVIAELKELDVVKRKYHKLERSLLSEETRTRAQFDELSRPMNLHRWRSLESSDPKRFEKLNQIQLLQREVIMKSDEMDEKELLIQEKEKVYVELKNIIARQPGTEVEEQILAFQLVSKDKSKHLACMNEEISMYRQQITIFKEEIIDLDNKLIALNQTWRGYKTQQELVM